MKPYNPQYYPPPQQPRGMGNVGPWPFVFLFLAGGGGFAYWKWQQSKKQAQASAEALQGDLATRQAAIIRNAIAGAGTDEEALFKVAQEITNWQAVTKAYASLTQGGNIEADLSDDLSSEDYQKFMDYLQYKGRDGGNSGGAVSKAVIFIDKQPATPPSNLPVGSKVFINWKQKADPNKPQVKVYADPKDYPLKTLYVIPRPMDTNPKLFGKVVQFKTVTYANGNTQIKLVQVHNGQRLVWLRLLDIGKIV